MQRNSPLQPALLVVADCIICERPYPRIPPRRGRPICSEACRLAGRKASKDRYRNANRARHLAYNRAWNRANREAANAATQRWRERNPDKVLAQRLRRVIRPETKAEVQRRRRARKKTQTVAVFSVAQLAARLSMWPGCWICGGVATEPDHVKPLSKGGPHMLANLRPICAPCNKRKLAKWPFNPQELRAERSKEWPHTHSSTAGSK